MNKKELIKKYGIKKFNIAKKDTLKSLGATLTTWILIGDFNEIIKKFYGSKMINNEIQETLEDYDKEIN